MLYLLRFEDIFKIGITEDLNRIYRLTKIYSAFGPLLHTSYLVEYNKRKTIKSLETLLHDHFEEYRHTFQGEITHGGYTEFFRNDCFSDVLKLVQEFVNSKNRFSTENKMHLVKGILLEIDRDHTDGKKKKLKSQKGIKRREGIDPYERETILNMLQLNKGNLFVDIKKENNKTYSGEITFNERYKPETEIPFVRYYFKNEGRHDSFCLFPSVISLEEQNGEGIRNVFFEIQPLAFEYPEAILFYLDIFEAMGLRDLINEMVQHFVYNNNRFSTEDKLNLVKVSLDRDPHHTDEKVNHFK
ncbi:GIY-YIG nuclease family protein [Domibacillus sp. A3M-37]|uniref:GIY-YIG nuclease family protein n=1 Tax=Domibacillus sp. A3M-37 TaxID=2962037 RepID=UPI0020B8DB49|nr:GIY-YIG nuclease family protein [Domibacillus sp. A3M-37]MCP3763761.1 GIY-YIG nuclease family protein [Domibacillus sp. A3M-37]